MMTRREPRSDGLQNRARILEIARDALATSPDASLNSIATAAGVGVGTLYRHFPSREALVLAVYHHEFQHLVSLAPSLIAAHPPLKALRLWFDHLAHYGRVKHGLAHALQAGMTDNFLRETYRPMIEAIDFLLRACEKSEGIREGVSAEDLFLLLGFLWRIPPGPEGEQQEKRMLDFVMGGLRPIANQVASDHGE